MLGSKNSLVTAQESGAHFCPINCLNFYAKCFLQVRQIEKNLNFPWDFEKPKLSYHNKATFQINQHGNRNAKKIIDLFVLM